jgi:hypothetical protein
MSGKWSCPVDFAYYPSESDRAQLAQTALRFGLDPPGLQLLDVVRHRANPFVGTRILARSWMISGWSTMGCKNYIHDVQILRLILLRRQPRSSDHSEVMRCKRLFDSWLQEHGKSGRGLHAVWYNTCNIPWQ